MTTKAPVDIALVHHPVLNRHGEEISAQIDEFDFFDACRLALTYPVRTFYVVNPLSSQRQKCERLIRWGTDPARAQEQRGIFDRIVWAPDLLCALEHAEQHGPRPQTVVTSAAPSHDATSFGALRQAMHDDPRPRMLLFGKAWGLPTSFMADADLRLEPIDTGTGYNHLSVRSAMAIVIDRLLAGD